MKIRNRKQRRHIYHVNLPKGVYLHSFIRAYVQERLTIGKAGKTNQKRLPQNNIPHTQYTCIYIYIYMYARVSRPRPLSKWGAKPPKRAPSKKQTLLFLCASCPVKCSSSSMPRACRDGPANEGFLLGRLASTSKFKRLGITKVP